MAKGDMNSLSKAKDLAINAIEFAVICNLTESCSPSTYNKEKINQKLIKNFNKKKNKPL